MVTLAEQVDSGGRRQKTQAGSTRGNGLAAGTVNYPGAAAHTGSGRSGFCGVEHSDFLGSTPIPLNIYYDTNWQAVETRANGTAASDVTSQMVWSAAYINAAILQDTYSAGAIQPNSRLYYLQDANWDTTAIVGYNSTAGTWGVTQRYVYSPYGSITVLNADWITPATGVQPVVNNLYQGMTLDAVTGLYYSRNRNYSPTLGTWISQDPLSYVNGANTYQFVGGNPADSVDPSGLAIGHHIIPGKIYNEPNLFNSNSPGYKFFKKFVTGGTTPRHGNSTEHSDYTKAVRKLIQKWLKDHPKVDPECKEFSEEDAKAIADDVLKSDDPDIRNFLRSVFKNVTQPSKYFKQMMDTFDTAAGEVAGQGQPVAAAQAIAGSGPIPGTENLTEDQLVQYEDAASNAQQADIAAQQSEGVLGEAIDSIDAGLTDIEFFLETKPPPIP